MPSKRSTSKSRPLRRPKLDRTRAPQGTDAPYPVDALQQALEAQRSRLMTVEAILHCVALAMDGGLREGAQPYYPTLIELARSLLAQSIDGLESVRMKPLIEKLDARACGEIREGVVQYIH